jgi:hypothetical protein
MQIEKLTGIDEKIEKKKKNDIFWLYHISVSVCYVLKFLLLFL